MVSGFTSESVSLLATQNGFSITEKEELPGRAPTYLQVPERLDAAVKQILTRKYPKGLYSHQSQAIDAALDGEDICLATPTASGKSDVFISLALDFLRKDRASRVLAMYPALALIQDQLGKWTSMLRDLQLEPAFIDGSVDTKSRPGILNSHRVVLMTPDVTHAWMMGNLELPEISQFLSNLSLLILDEAHVYEGVFGTNMAYFLRRFQVAARSYQSIYSTATLGDSKQFIYELTGKQARCFGQDDDGSASPPKSVLLATGGKFESVANFLSELALDGKGRFLAFADSRKEVEQLVAATRRLRDKEEKPEDSGDYVPLRQDNIPLVPPILPYRAGYENQDRVEIQTALSHGRLSGVACTSALELGIDIGEIDLVIMLNTPPSAKAFWQRLGRGGRRNPGVCLILDRQGTITSRGLKSQLNRALEPNWMYLENRSIQYTNALCAAAECNKIGFGERAVSIFESLPPTFRQFLQNEIKPVEAVPDDLFILKQRAETNPHHQFLLRSGVEKQFNIKVGDDKRLGTLTLSQVLREGYPGAVYYHMARPYRVEHMNYQDGAIIVRQTRYWQTKPIAQTMVFPKFPGGVLSIWRSGSSFLAEARMQVSERVLGFLEQRGSAKPEQQLYGPGSSYYQHPLNRFFETTGVCWYFSEHPTVTDTVADLICEAFCSEFGILSRDLGVGRFSSKQPPFGTGESTGVCIYDAADGSLRLTQHLGEHFVQVLQAAKSIAATRDQSDAQAVLVTFDGIARDLEKVLSGGKEYQNSGDDAWIEVIAAGQQAMYVTDLDTREVETTGYRYTPRGIYYDIKDDKVDKHSVPANCLRPIFGKTRVVVVNFMTSEERPQPTKQ